jgi:hypothetical protein
VLVKDYKEDLFHHYIQSLGRDEIIRLLIGEGDPTLVDDPGEGIVVRLLIPAGVVILGVCHLVLAQVSGHQQMVLRSSLGYFVLHKEVLIFMQSELFLDWLRIKLESIFPSLYSVSWSK